MKLDQMPARTRREALPMMIDKRLIGTVPESRKYIAANVTLQWCGLVANVAMMMSVASLLASQLSARASSARLLTTAAVARPAPRA